jgi:hypothetical protein
MRIFVSAVITGLSAVFIGDLYHSAAAGFAALVVLSALVITAVTVASRRQAAEAS